MAERRPLIGMNGNLEQRGGVLRLDIPERYGSAVLAAGGLPVGLFGLEAGIEGLLEGLDGLVLTGGDDFDMQRLGLGATHPAALPVPAAKQDFDLRLARRAIELGLPVLGICYGMQLLALAEGGQLYQHLPEDRPQGGPHGGALHGGQVRHRVEPAPGSQLAGLVGVEPFEVESRHHQALAGLGPTWRACAHDPEGLIEAIERPGTAFALGVQWHPDLQVGERPARALFAGLVAAARERSRTHRGSSTPPRTNDPLSTQLPRSR